mmetsp:Transcript_19976/g.37113  ORF Transcript_19976/g.37113 Transcript_19976/m.37113 type:complete len:535 (-) Transcript_19976:212-1816(-)
MSSQDGQLAGSEDPSARQPPTAPEDGPVKLEDVEGEKPGVTKDGDDLSDTSGSEIDSDDDDSSWPAEERVARAESCKATGNEHFKQGQNEDAIKMYAKGTQVLKPLVDLEPPELDAGVKQTQVELHVSLLLNQTAAELKLSRWSSATKTSTLALQQIDRSEAHLQNPQMSRVKGLFRRAQSHTKVGSLEEGKSDLVALLKLDRSNKEALREYTRVKKILQASREQEKKMYSAAFEKMSLSGGMYKDQEIERKRKALKKIEDERLRRAKWKSEVENTRDKDMSFEDWCKKDDERIAEEKRKEEEERQARRKKEDEERAKRAAEARARRAAEGNDDDDELELDEEDRKALAEKKSYCYFRTEHTEEEKALLASSGHSKPSKIQSGDTAGEDEAAVTSAWNANGTTWEEKDITSSAKEKLEAALSAVSGKITEGEIAVTKVTSVAGHAQIVVTRSKPAPVLDMSAKLKWTLTPSDGSEAVSGTAELSDISTGVLQDLEIKLLASGKQATSDIMAPALEILRTELRSAVNSWAEELAK